MELLAKWSVDYILMSGQGTCDLIIKQQVFAQSASSTYALKWLPTGVGGQTVPRAAGLQRWRAPCLGEGLSDRPCLVGCRQFSFRLTLKGPLGLKSYETRSHNTHMLFAPIWEFASMCKAGALS